MIKVSLAYIFNDSGHVLIAKRNLEKHFGGLWEFPGGKINQAETVENSITRELDEELQIRTSVKRVYRSYSYMIDDGSELEFYPVLVKWISGAIRPTEHEEFVFVDPTLLSNFDLAPPDYEAVKILLNDCVANNDHRF